MSTEDKNADRMDFEGVFALLLSPFQTDGRIDWDCYDRYVDWQLNHRPSGLFAVCGSSEMNNLNLEERLALATRAVERAGPVPVLATANLEPDVTMHGAEVARMASTGVAGLVLVPPDGLGQNQNELLDYFASLADQADCPVFLYEWPQRKPCEIAPETYAALVRDHGVHGIKDTTCTREGILAKIEAAPTAVVYQANTPFLIDALEYGARGIMAITSTAAADLLVEFWTRFTGGEPQAALQHQQLIFLDAILRFGYPASAKYLVHLRGLPIELTCRTQGVLSREAARALSVWWDFYNQV